MRFIGYCRFVLGSLENLAKNLKDEKFEAVKKF